MDLCRKIGCRSPRKAAGTSQHCVSCTGFSRETTTLRLHGSRNVDRFSSHVTYLCAGAFSGSSLIGRRSLVELSAQSVYECLCHTVASSTLAGANGVHPVPSCVCRVTHIVLGARLKECGGNGLRQENMNQRINEEQQPFTTLRTRTQTYVKRLCACTNKWCAVWMKAMR